MTVQLRIDRTRCAGHGICALFAGTELDLDTWGFPEVHEGALDPGALPRVRRAIASCPRQALFLEDLAPPERSLRAP